MISSLFRAWRDMVNIHQSRHSCLLQTAESLFKTLLFFVHWLNCQNRHPPEAHPHDDPQKSSSHISKGSILTVFLKKTQQTNSPNLKPGIAEDFSSMAAVLKRSGHNLPSSSWGYPPLLDQPSVMDVLCWCMSCRVNSPTKEKLGLVLDRWVLADGLARYIKAWKSNILFSFKLEFKDKFLKKNS